MSRAQGANAVLALAIESAYGVPPGSGFYKMPFVTSNLGEEQGLLQSDLLGMGREPLPPSDEPVTNDGDVVVPVDARYLGLWLTLLFGEPTTTQGVAATGNISFSAQPANNATITINGQAFTFVTGTPTTNQIKIGATLAETLENAVLKLNASVVSGVAAARYELDLTATKILVVHKTIGAAGNSFTLAAGDSPASNGTVSAGTLAGGSASGPRNHVFTSGALALPSASIETGNPDIDSFEMNSGGLANTLGIQLQRTGHLNATIGMICQGSAPPTAATAAGTPAELAIDRFSQFSGLVSRNGVPLGSVVSGQFNWSNGVEKDESIRPDGRIGGADPAQTLASGQVGVRYANNRLRELAESREVIELSFGWSGPAGSLRIVNHAVRLPKAKHPITGPGGIQADYPWQAHRHPGLGRALTVTLVNDVASY